MRLGISKTKKCAFVALPDFLVSKGYIKILDGQLTKIIRKNKVLDKRILGNNEFQKAIKYHTETHDKFMEKSKHLAKTKIYRPEDYFNIQNEIQNLGNVESRMKAILMSEIKRRDDIIPIIDAFRPFKISSKAKLINLTIEQFPIPNYDVPWQKLFGFKENKDSINKKYDLKNWINELSEKEIDPKIFSQKLEYLIHEYEKDLKNNKFEYSKELVKVVLRLPFKTAENLFKIKWGNIVDPIFQIGELTYDLFNIEKKSKNKQVGYIVKSKRKFDK
jgi:hypothetical protein